MKFLNFLLNVEMADVMRSEGKIYVVVAGLVIVVAGFLAYLFFLDKKIGKLEKEVDNLRK